MANWSFQDPGDAIADNAVIDSGNFSQLNPDTPIMVGKPLHINGGNWTNVRKDTAWTVNGGNWTQVDRCSHLHLSWTGMGLSECVIECAHMTDKDEVIVDGQLVNTFYHYADTRIV